MKERLLTATIFLNNISGERYWDFTKAMPSKIDVQLNVNVMKIEKRGGAVEAPFVYTVSYSPLVAQIVVKGVALISGDENELTNLERENIQGKPLPPFILNAIFNTCITESILISRVLGAPPPIPPLPPPPKPTQKPAYA